jgi:hypothetical protein
MKKSLAQFLADMSEQDAALTDSGYVMEQLRLQAQDLMDNPQQTKAYFHGVNEALLKLLLVCCLAQCVLFSLPIAAL